MIGNAVYGECMGKVYFRQLDMVDYTSTQGHMACLDVQGHKLTNCFFLFFLFIFTNSLIF